MSQPPTFELLVGPPGQYYYFQDEVFARVATQTTLDADFIYLLPVKRAVRYFTAQLIDHSPRETLPRPPVYTFYQFMIECYHRLPDARKVISPVMRLFLVEEVLKENIPRLRFFSPTSARRKGLVRKIDATLVEMREYGYSAEELLRQQEGEDNRIHDFSLLIDAFEAKLEGAHHRDHDRPGGQLIDEAGAIQLFLARLDADLWRYMFPHIDTLYLSGYGLFSQPMISFIEKIRPVCSLKVKLDIIPEYAEGAQLSQFFAHVHPAYEALSDMKPLIVQKESPQPWELSLFRRQPGEQGEPPADILIQPVNSRAEEVTFIANYIKRLHYHHDIPLHKIGITFPSVEKYAPLIHDTFPRLGLPYNISSGFPLKQSPLIRSFMLLLETCLSGYEVNRLSQLVNSPFFRPAYDLPPLTSADLQFLSEALRVTRFSRSWETQLDRKISWLEQRIAQAIHEEDDFDQQAVAAQIERLNAVREPLQRLITVLAELEPPQPVAEFRQKFLALLKTFGFLDWYDNEESILNPWEREQEYRAFNRFIKTVDQFSWVVSNLHAGRKLSLRDLSQYLSLLVGEATYNVREWSNYGLQIMPRLEILSVEPRVIIFGGVMEGDFPRPFTHDVFFNDEKRESLGLAATEDLLAQDSFIFYQMLRSGAARLVFTYPRFEQDANRVASSFLHMIADHALIRWRRQSPSPAFLRHRRELLEEVAAAIPAGLRRNDLRKMALWHALESRPRVTAGARFWSTRVRSGFQKHRRNHFGLYEGMLGSDPRILAALERRFAKRAFSITRLETYAFCPMEFFLQYMLHLSEREPVESGLTPLERGDLVHTVLFRFYRELQAAGSARAPWQHLERLVAIAEEEFARLPLSGVLFDLEKERYFGNGRQAGLWAALLQTEREEMEKMAFFPELFEVAFGKTGRKADQDPASLDHPLTLEKDGRTLTLTGKIDRVDVSEDGRAMIIDYKTGSSFGRAGDILRGTSLQLPVYAALLPGLLKASRSSLNVDPVIATIYQVRDEKNCQRQPIIFDREALPEITTRSHAALPNRNISDDQGAMYTFQQLVARSVDALFAYRANIERGRFRHTSDPENAHCAQHCDFRRVCRKEVRKLIEEKRSENSS